MQNFSGPTRRTRRPRAQAHGTRGDSATAASGEAATGSPASRRDDGVTAAAACRESARHRVAGPGFEKSVINGVFVYVSCIFFEVKVEEDIFGQRNKLYVLVEKTR